MILKSIAFVCNVAFITPVLLVILPQYICLNHFWIDNELCGYYLISL